MSDSEDEAFQSADEGEEAAAKLKQSSPDTVKGMPSTGTSGSTGESSLKGNKKPQGKRQRKKKSRGQGKSEKEGQDSEATSSKDAEAVKAVTSTVKVEDSSKSDPGEVQPETASEVPAAGDTTATEHTVVTTETDTQRLTNVNEEEKQKPEADVEESVTADKAGGDVIAKQPSVQPVPEVSSPEKPTEQQQSILDKLSGVAGKQATNWGGWGSWGSSLLSTATSSVTTFTQQVGEGLNTVLETVESTLGAPDPEELAKQERVARDAKEPDETPNGRSECSQEAPEEESKEEAGAMGGESGKNKSWSPWGGWGLSEVTKAVGETGKTLVSGGLDVLESIGKTTYNVIAEGDHGLKSTIRHTGQKPNLSQILRDAKLEHEEKAKMMEEYDEARKANFGALFDEYNGLVHLEALELVSTQCDSKVQSLLGTMSHSDLNILKKDLIAIKDKFEIDDESDDDDDIEPEDEHTYSEQCKEIMVELGLPLTSDRLALAFDRCRAWLKDCQEEQMQGVKMSPKEIHRMGIQSMAELTANSVQQFHKVAQLLQMTATGPLTIHVNRADCLSRLTRLLCTEVSYISVKFTSCLNSFTKDFEDNKQSLEINPLITNIYLEASNSKTYIEDAFRLLLPVVQHTALLAYSKEKEKEGEDSS